jgi:CBS-domain-containing membrane protein
LNRVVNLVLLGIATGITAMAAVPEIDPASGASALALLAGTVVVIRGLRRK